MIGAGRKAPPGSPCTGGGGVVSWGMDLSDFRQEYAGQTLRRADLAADPVRQFAKWFEEAVKAGYHEPNAMSLATVGATGEPTLRTVLLKGFDERGFVFFTNYQSRKSIELEANPRAGLLFPWVALERQVFIRGEVEKISREESLAYFRTRPRDSQLGAWVSHQSAVIPSRAVLETELEDLRAKFGDEEIPLPPFWGGYRVRPRLVEFWQGGPGRLHDRFLYTREDADWRIERLSP
jgi:pyridoxamine 5'-phosphate oxidase